MKQSADRGADMLNSQALEAGLYALATPIAVLICFTLRHLELPPVLPGTSCTNHECQLLLGTAFALSQLATILHFVILFGAIPLIRSLRSRIRNRAVDEGKHDPEFSLVDMSFGSILSNRLMEGLLLLVFAFPCTILIAWIIRFQMFAHEDQIAWNIASIASILFLSSTVMIAMLVIAAATDPTFSNHLQFQSIMVVFLVLLVKSTFGKVIYAFSSTTNWGQMDNHLYDNFLKIMNTSVGTIGGHHFELLLCSMYSLLPIFVVVGAMKTYETIVGSSKLFWKNIISNSGKTEYDEKFLCAVDILTLRFRVPRILFAAEFGFICWFAWYAFVTCSSDDVIIPYLAGLFFLSIYSRCRAVSPSALRAYSAVIENDLLLQPDFQSIHTKLE